MTHILTLVAAGTLDPKHVAAATEYLEGQGLTVAGKPDVLAKGKACDLPFAQRPSPAQMRDLRGMFDAEKVDVFVTPSQNRRKKLLLADMESTMITGEMLDELAKELGPAAQEKIAGITARAMRGEIDFTGALHERVGLLKGLSAHTMEKVRAAIVPSDGAKTLIATMRAHGAHCVLVSGGFTFFAAPVAADLGFDAHHANVLEIEGDALSGGVAAPILDKDAKLHLLQRYIAERGLSAEDSLAVGDGANDLPMLQGAGLGIGYRPKPLLLDALDNCVVHTDLTALLYAQGFRQENLRTGPDQI